MDHVDVLIVGAGLSGIGTACHLTRDCPERTYAILEGRGAIGGTWDIFRYPGIRSDSDMFTLGYDFKPWTTGKAIADGPSIRDYVRETAKEYDVEKNIRFHHNVKRASWNSDTSAWTVQAENTQTGETVRVSCNFLMMCPGYYNYEHGYVPEFEGVDDYKGQIVHPQFWPEDLDYADKKVAVIGSGATAMTIVPSMAMNGANVTMVQRSPTYVVSRPAVDTLAERLQKLLPAQAAYQIIRWRNVLLQMFFYNQSRKRPAYIKKRLLDMAREEIGDDCVDQHFTPTYNPWDQRLCLIPDADLFETIRDQKVHVVTDHIESFTEAGLKLKSGQHLEADIIVMATGLDLKFMGGLEVEVDGKRIAPADQMYYRGAMLSDVPNLALIFGYTNASWTLKADLVSEYVCRILNHMGKHGFTKAVPQLNDWSVEEETWLDFTSGYIQRSIHKFPKQGNKKPWKLNQNYALDTLSLRFGALDDGALTFSGSKSQEVRKSKTVTQSDLASAEAS